MFTESYARQLRAFLAEDWGQSLIQELEHSRPPLEGDSMEATYGNAKRAEGWELCIDRIKQLSEKTEHEQVDVSYIDLSKLDPK